MWMLLFPFFQFSSALSPCEALADSVAALAQSAPRQAAMFGRALASRCGSHPDALLRAGRALNRAADFGGAMADVAVRDAAAELLDRAIRRRPHNAAAWFEYGLLLRKRQGAMLDAQRAIRRAVALAEQYPDSVPQAVRSEILLQRARDLQEWVDQLRWLKDSRTIAINTLSCSDLGTFCENYVRPAQFNEALRDARAVYPDLDRLREELLVAYDRALRFDTGSAEILTGIARELALGEEWEPLAALARRAAASWVAAARFGTVEALARHRLGDLPGADSLFRGALPSLPDSLRLWYDRPPPGLDTITDFWARARSLSVVPLDELRLEYWARVTYALLALGDHEAAVLGPETPQGDAMIRYGWPRRLTQISRRGEQILRPTQIDAILAYLNCAGEGGGPLCQGFEPTMLPAGASPADFSGGRWIFWTYDDDRPSLVFERRTGQRVPEYERHGAAERYAVELRGRSPFVFKSRLAPRTVPLPAQVTRFRADARSTNVLVHATAPGQAMGAAANDSIETGLFVFGDRAGYPVLARSLERRPAVSDLTLTYSFALAPARYAYSFEAWSPALGSAVTSRDTLRITAWPNDSVSLSDVLVAERVAPLRVPPLRWSDLAIAPLPMLVVVPGAPFALVWESYGVEPGTDGVARYDLTLEVRDDNGRALLMRLLDRIGLGRPLGEAAVQLTWRAERPMLGDVLLDYVTVQLPPDATGRLRLVLTVRDVTTGRLAASERMITVRRPW